ncbi:Glyoxalase/Bleomycin resistance protein/Dihydroxybiphenyl dioxygenase [Hypoxylon fragiforme]|uniref:Glyoxalase/Bleomycin resistance protein/Dihydroxybiphenyl dioxygenase n=1 Tax=Hypoxylon fragiforme TaxID=63214 RepID=UPI0020C723DA|nr:Glyoxalase/Bleomycin resistance protein/Dihydroxybiphenyl dioxygenase [Hypoxylon fragiforme]KAI2604047.1 Glyoxalase/Bleomycin resistance protein/Dihydroxybiphenyl dioxygenase [Hypoxylon fragiforme]
MFDADLNGKVISPSRMAHVVLRTAQFKPMIEFYKAVLGAHVVMETSAMAFLTYDDEHHRIAIIAIPGCGATVPNTAGLEHIAFTYDTLEDLLTAYLQRKARGILPIWSVNHGPTMSLYYQDPDRNKIETQVDIFDTPEEATKILTSPELQDNPFGVDFDPDDLIRRLKNGEPEAELMKLVHIGTRGFDSVPLVNTPAPFVKDSYEPIDTAA